MIEFDRATLKNILVEYKFDIPSYEWRKKEHVLFELKAKYGESFNSNEAEELYDEIRKKEPQLLHGVWEEKGD